MKYREAGTLCSGGCGKERRKGQRDCAECHAKAMRTYRKKKVLRTGTEILDRASQHLAQQCWREMPKAEFKANMDARCLLVSLQIKVLNEPMEQELKAA